MLRVHIESNDRCVGLAPNVSQRFSVCPTTYITSHSFVRCTLYSVHYIRLFRTYIQAYLFEHDIPLFKIHLSDTIYSLAAKRVNTYCCLFSSFAIKSASRAHVETEEASSCEHKRPVHTVLALTNSNKFNKLQFRGD